MVVPQLLMSKTSGIEENQKNLKHNISHQTVQKKISYVPSSNNFRSKN